MTVELAGKIDLQRPQALAEGQFPQISTVQPQQIEGDIVGLPGTAEEVVKLRSAARVRHDHLAVQELALYSNKEQYNVTVTHGLPLGNDGENLHAQVVGFGPTIPKGAKNVAAAKEFITYMLEPKVLNQYLKGGLGRFAVPIPEIANSDPFWLEEDPHRTVHTRQTLFGPTLPIYEAYNPAIAQVDAEHVFSIAEFDVIKNGMAPEAAIDKAFRRAEEIFAKYPITQA